MLVFLLEAYEEEQDKEGLRTILRLHFPAWPRSRRPSCPFGRAPGRAPGGPGAADLRRLAPGDAGAVRRNRQRGGRRYRRQDEIGTPWCLTVDSQSLEDGTVTIRDRDSMAQERIPADGVPAEIQRRRRAVGAPRGGGGGSGGGRGGGRARGGGGGGGGWGRGCSPRQRPRGAVRQRASGSAHHLGAEVGRTPPGRRGLVWWGRMPRLGVKQRVRVTSKGASTRITKS